MNSGLDISDPTVVAAFRSALLHQGLIALLIFGVLAAAWVSLRAWGPASSGGGPAAPGPAVPVGTEPAGRQLLVIGFGNLWLFDGFLQAQPKLPMGLPSQVIEPTAASSPTWVQHVANWGATAWSYHPIQAGAAAVWIEVGLGIWMLAAPRGAMSRLAALVSVGWGLIVWTLGESFGGIFAPAQSWLSGAPGAAAIYVVAGALIALPDRAWRSPRLGRLTLAGLGLFLAGMAVLQAWPGRGFWQGISHQKLGTLAGMVLSMSVTPQPGFLSARVAAFGAFDGAHGFAVNLFAVAALAVTGAVFLSGRRRLIRPVCIGFVVVCLADWVLIEDLGFLGGVGTDPGSMIPFALLAAGGYLALSTATAAIATAAAGGGGHAERAAGPAVPATAPFRARWRSRASPAVLCQRAVAAGTPFVAALGGAGLIVLGAVPMAVAQASPNADPILAASLAGSSVPLDLPAAGFTLTDQYGRTVQLASLRGKVVLLSFVDPACTTGCPPVWREFRQAGKLLGASAHQVALVGIVLSPSDRSVSALQAFDRQQGLGRVPGWRYLTGTLSQLQRVWQEYGITARNLAAGTTALYAEAYVIDRTGHVRQKYRTGPGQGTAAIRSSFAVLLAAAARQALNAR